MKRTARGIGPFGPLFFAPEGDGGAGNGQPSAGDPGAGGGGSALPPTAQPPTTPPGQPESTVPYARFSEVNAELQKLRQAEEQRQRDELAKKGEHEQLAQREKSAREAAEQRATTIGRRAAFVAKAVAKATDPEAAYKLAMADGLLSNVEIDDEGNPKDGKAVETAVDETLKRYAFLKAGPKNSDFGAPAGGNGQPGQAEPKTARDMLAAGYSQLGAPTRR